MTTTPVEPTHGEPVTFHVVVTDPGGLYPFPKELAYGDGRVADGFAGPACIGVPAGYVVRPPTGPPRVHKHRYLSAAHCLDAYIPEATPS